MRNIALVDETFDINITASYHLSVELCREGISYAVLDTLRKKYIALKTLIFEKAHPSTVEDQVKRIFKTDNYLIQRYKSSGIIIASPDFALVPDPLFDPGKQEELFRFSNQLPAGNEILVNSISSIETKILFPVPGKILNAVKINPNNFKIVHQSCPLIETAFLETKGKAGESMVYVQVFEDFFDILIFRKGKFELYNTFTYKTEQDFLFYLLYVYEQFGLDPGEVVLSLYGHIDQKSNLIDKLSQFLPKIHYPAFGRNYTYSYTFGQLKQYQYTNLINLYSCV